MRCGLADAIVSQRPMRRLQAASRPCTAGTAGYLRAVKSLLFFSSGTRTALPYPFGQLRAGQALRLSPFWVTAITAMFAARDSNDIGFNDRFAYGSPASAEASTRCKSNGVPVAPPDAGFFYVWVGSPGIPFRGGLRELGGGQANIFIAWSACGGGPEGSPNTNVIGSRRTIYAYRYNHARNQNSEHVH